MKRQIITVVIEREDDVPEYEPYEGDSSGYNHLTGFFVDVGYKVVSCEIVPDTSA